MSLVSTTSWSVLPVQASALQSRASLSSTQQDQQHRLDGNRPKKSKRLPAALAAASPTTTSRAKARPHIMLPEGPIQARHQPAQHSHHKGVDGAASRKPRNRRRRRRMDAVSTQSDDDGDERFETSSLTFALRASAQDADEALLGRLKGGGGGGGGGGGSGNPRKRSKRTNPLKSALRAALNEEQRRMGTETVSAPLSPSSPASPLSDTAHEEKLQQRQAREGRVISEPGERRDRSHARKKASKRRPDPRRISTAAAISASSSTPAPLVSMTGAGTAQAGPRDGERRRRERRSASDRLKGAKFRMLNEMLYTTSGVNAFDKFSRSPELFEAYHEGFVTQVNKWPVNPLDNMIEDMKRQSPSLVVADFGCGEARLAASVPNKVHSFDLVACNDRVVACDIAHVPLKNASVDVAVFCLALMGTNYPDYLMEANRVLKNGGTLKIAEVKSRILKMDEFIALVSRLGFEFVSMDDSNKMFVALEFSKAASRRICVDQDMAGAILQPCIYKRR